MTNRVLVLLVGTVLAGIVPGTNVTVTRFPENPLITLDMSSTIGDNANGPSVIHVPNWVEHPMGRYYMYFAHHKGGFIRLCDAQSTYSTCPRGLLSISGL